jgi:hypothetical protein
MMQGGDITHGNNMFIARGTNIIFILIAMTITGNGIGGSAAQGNGSTFDDEVL